MPDDLPRSALLDISVAGGAQTVLSLTGDLDPATAPQLEQAIADAGAQPGVQQVTLDLAGVAFLDSSGLRVFVTARESLSAQGADLALRNPSANIVRLLDITGLSEIIAVE